MPYFSVRGSLHSSHHRNCPPRHEEAAEDVHDTAAEEPPVEPEVDVGSAEARSALHHQRLMALVARMLAMKHRKSLVQGLAQPSVLGHSSLGRAQQMAPVVASSPPSAYLVQMRAVGAISDRTGVGALVLVRPRRSSEALVVQEAGGWVEGAGCMPVLALALVPALALQSAPNLAFLWSQALVAAALDSAAA
jgi:hypothetical protein